MIKYFTIYGERCSGTHYLQNLISMNFDIELTWRFGSKHFIGFNNLSNNEDTIFLCIVRNPLRWINSFYRNPWHLPFSFRNNVHNFLNNEFLSFQECTPGINAINERMKDRNMYTLKRYKNIFEMRHTKLKYLIDDMPLKVKHHIIIKYEDLINDFENTMNRIKDYGLQVKKNILFPLNTYKYKDTNQKYTPNNTIIITNDMIYNNRYFNPYYEKILGYI